MNIHLLKDKKHGGTWVMIVGCPLPEKHDLKDQSNGMSGPSFATCAGCEHQIGINFEVLNADGGYDGSSICAELLKCGMR